MRSKWFKICSLCLAMTMGLSITSFAKEERTKVGTVTINIEANYSEKDEVDEGDFSVTTDSEVCEVSGYELDYSSATKEGGEAWSKYDTPVLVIYLTAYDDHYFDKTSKGSFKLTGAKSTYLSASSDNDKTEVTLKVQLNSLNGKVGNVSGLSWSDTSIGHWVKGFNTKKYEVRLYCNNRAVNSYETSNLSYDFATDMKKAGAYYFSVRGVSSSNVKSDWIDSGVINITDVQANDLSHKAVDNTKTHEVSNTNTAGPSGGNNNTVNGPTGPGSATTGNWLRANDGRWWYRHTDGSYTINNWELINNAWYLFDNEGWMLTGWRMVNNKWYFMDLNSGAMLKGWQQINGLWYYLDPVNGDMWANRNTPDGYYVNADGVWR